MKYYYCWSCRKKLLEPSYYKNCDNCHQIYLENPNRKFSRCRYCDAIKDYDTKTLCKRCYVAVKESDKKEREMMEGRS